MRQAFNAANFAEGRRFSCSSRSSCPRGRQDEELEYLREMLEKQKAERDRAIDKGLLERELEAARKQAGALRSNVEVNDRISCFSLKKPAAPD